ncbi:MAG: DMT family transporter [Oligoflexia bacterium]|nr:DMT family transporter [Oligoflexia bacterium]
MGEFYALLCAIIWAFAVILIKKSMEIVSPYALNLYRVCVASILLLITVAITGDLFWKGTREDYLLLALSGILSIAISDTLFHFCLDYVGASVAAIIDCFYSPFVVITAYILLDEKLTPLKIFGMLLVMSAAVLAIYKRGEGGQHLPGQRPMLGLLLGVLAMLTIAIGVVIAKPVLERSPILWATTIRQLVSALVLLLFTLGMPRRKQIFAIFRPSRAWLVAFPATLCASYLGLLFWLASMKYTEAGISAIISQTSTIFVLILASIFFKERITKRKLVAVLLAFSGIVLVSL